MFYGLFSLQTNLCILLHDQCDVLWHNGPNYEQLLFSSDNWPGTSAMGKCAFFYMWHWFGVVVFQRCIVNWGDVCDGYMCILLYVTLIWCSGVPEMYVWLLGGGQWERVKWWEQWNYLQISQSDMRFHISQYKMQCSGVAVMYAQKEGAIWCNDLACSYGWLIGGLSAFGIYVHSPMHETYLV